MTNLEEYIVTYLKKFSIEAVKIPESSERTPDFLIDQQERVLIELKEKVDEEDKYVQKNQILDDGGVFEDIGSTARKNRFSGIIGDGVKQLLQQKEKKGANFCLLFIVASGISPGNQVEQISSTLYGIKYLVDFASESGQAKCCFYATYSDFHRYKEVLDGVFLASNGNVQLAVNSCSERYEELLKSSFYEKISKGVSIIDPFELENNGSAVIADCDFARSDEESVKKYVFEKYGIAQGLIIDFPHMSYTVRV